MKKRIKIQGFLIFVAIALSFLFSKFLFRQPQNSILSRFIDGFGAGLFLLGFLLRIAARGYKAEMSLESKRLVISGPYRLIRNPMYLGTLLIGLGIILALFAWWINFIFLAVFLWIYMPQIRHEEQILSQRFGQDYQAYCKKTPRLFPTVPAWFKTDLRESLAFKKIWLKKEIGSLAAAVAFIMAIKIWQGSGAFRVFLVIVVLAAIIYTVFHEKKDTAAKG